MSDDAPETNNKAGEFLPAGLIDHLQRVVERQKALLARELHDDLGGLLVGAAMDLAWVERHLDAPAADVQLKLARARHALAGAIDLKRRIIEDLRPTLLDNVGLFAALRWHVRACCDQANIPSSIDLPEEEPKFRGDMAISLFRVLQDSLALVLAQSASRVDLTVSLSAAPAPPRLTMDLLAILASTPRPLRAAAGIDRHALAAIEGRVTTLAGQYHCEQDPADVIHVLADFPLAGRLAPAASA